MRERDTAFSAEQMSSKCRVNAGPSLSIWGVPLMAKTPLFKTRLENAPIQAYQRVFGQPTRLFKRIKERLGSHFSQWQQNRN